MTAIRPAARGRMKWAEARKRGDVSNDEYWSLYGSFGLVIWCCGNSNLDRVLGMAIMFASIIARLFGWRHE